MARASRRERRPSPLVCVNGHRYGATNLPQVGHRASDESDEMIWVLDVDPSAVPCPECSCDIDIEASNALLRKLRSRPS
jgi:hypothetical protein